MTDTGAIIVEQSDCGVAIACDVFLNMIKVKPTLLLSCFIRLGLSLPWLLVGQFDPKDAVFLV